MAIPNAHYRSREAVMIMDSFAVLAAYAMAFLLRFDFKLDPLTISALAATAPTAFLTYFLTSYYFVGCRSSCRRASFGDAADVLKAAASAALIQGAILIPVSGAKCPLSVLLMWPLLSLCGVAGLDSFACGVEDYRRASGTGPSQKRTAVIVGAGDLGERVYRSIRSHGTIDYRVAAFCDDDESKWGMRMHGAPVIGGVPALAALLRRVPVEEIIIAVGHSRGSVVNAVALALQGVEKRPGVRIAPNLDEMLNPQARSDPRNVRPADLLNRRVIALDNAGIARSIEGKVVLVTGAGGTIGGELTRQIILHRPAKIVLLENNATALFYCESELRGMASGAEVVAALGDVRDQSLLDQMFREHHPEIVFHAAAHKHVHQLEANIQEGVSNNLLGTYYLARAAERHGVDTFILISTDKAVRPSCVMGATKRAAEIVVTSLAHASKTRFAAVRFGNVLGSSGSVLKIFQSQIEKRQPITLTHPNAARYFMTVEEAVGLVLQASVLAKGGEIFVLKMGEQIRIMDLARSLILLSGLEPDRDVEIRVVGLKAGEKMTEELIEDASGQEQSEHPEIMVLRSENRRIESLAARILNMELMSLGSGNALLRALSQLVPTFTPDPSHAKRAAESLWAAQETAPGEKTKEVFMSKIKSISSGILLAAASLLWSQTSSAATWYVATTGSNSNPGTLASPFLTVQAGVNAASAGDTIIVRDGTYPGCPGGSVSHSYGASISKSGTSSAWITIQAEHKGAAILDGQQICHSYFDMGSSASYWIFQGLDMRNCWWAGIWSNSSGGKNIQIRGNVIHDMGGSWNNNPTPGIVGVFFDAGGTNITIDGNVFHHIGRTAPSGGSTDHSIYTHGTNSIITNNVFYSIINGWHIQLAVGFSGTLANNIFFGPDPYLSQHGQIMVWAAESNLIIRNNIFYAPTSVGIATYQSSISGTCSIDHNIVYSPTASVGLIDSLPSGCSQSSNLLNANPKLASPTVSPYSNANFQLLAGSPAIGAGVAVPAVTLDFNGVSRAGRNDIGAFQSGGGTTVAPPVISAVSATGVGQTAATIGWTTNVLADSQVVYGLTSAYGSATTLNTTLATSHSVALSGLTAGTVYHYAVKSHDSAGNLTTSPDATFTTSSPVVTAPPVISAVSATSVGQTAATIVWTTDKTDDSQVVYGLTSAYGSATTLSTALTTSHSVALSGLTAGTVYHYAVKSHDAAGNLSTSPDATFTTSAGTTPPPPGCVTSAGTWQNDSLAAQTGAFTAEFDATPAAANIDGVGGVSNAAATGWANLGAAVRFNNTGMIDARNGGAYAAAAAVPYVAGMSYHIRLVVNLTAHTYSAYAKQGVNAELLIGSGYAFRTEQAAVSTLNNLGVYTDAGSLTVCSPVVTGLGATTAVSGVSATGIGQTAATIGWTTNNPADTQVQYGLTSAYGTKTTLNGTLATSHSVALGGLTAGTVYHYQVMSRDALGVLATSPDATFTTSAAVVTAPPVISAVSATGITASGATVVWTTDKPADSQVVYVANAGVVTVIPVGSFYTSATTLNTTLATSHSVALGGLTAGTVYHYAVKSHDSPGNLTTSPDATFTTAAGSTPPPPACINSAGTWKNVPLTAQTGSFTAEFDATPGTLTTDGVSGLSNGAAAAFTSLAAIVRFNNTGKIDARNGGVYTAAGPISYVAGMSYHFRLVVNLPAHTYSAYVKQGANAELLIGANYSFRAEQMSAALINNLGVLADAGSVTDCNATAHP